MKRAAWAPVLLLSALVQAQPAPLEMQSLRRGSTGKVGVSEVFAVARSQPELAALWRVPFDSDGPNQPSINFDSTIVVGAVLASHPDGCTSVTVTDAQVVGRRVVVRFKRFKHRADEICTLAFTTAYHFVSVPKSDFPVFFEEQVSEQ